jgi:hypothetical protein
MKSQSAGREQPDVLLVEDQDLTPRREPVRVELDRRAVGREADLREAALELVRVHELDERLEVVRLEQTPSQPGVVIATTSPPSRPPRWCGSTPT